MEEAAWLKRLNLPEKIEPEVTRRKLPRSLLCHQSEPLPRKRELSLVDN